jgi:hypothetical protein
MGSPPSPSGLAEHFNTQTEHGRRGVTLPYVEEVVREVNGVPVVTRLRPMTVLEALDSWVRYAGRPRPPWRRYEVVSHAHP